MHRKLASVSLAWFGFARAKDLETEFAEAVFMVVRPSRSGFWEGAPADAGEMLVVFKTALPRLKGSAPRK